MSDPIPDPAPTAAAAAVPAPAEQQVSIRRAPKLGIFLAVGAFLGALATLIITSQFTPDPAVGFPATVGYFLLFGVPAGVVLGAIVGLLIDRGSVRRARTVRVTREFIEVADDPAPARSTAPRLDAPGARVESDEPDEPR